MRARAAVNRQKWRGSDARGKNAYRLASDYGNSAAYCIALGNEARAREAAPRDCVRRRQGSVVQSAYQRSSQIERRVCTLTPPESAEGRMNLRRYVDLFNGRDWDGLRALVGEESRLDQVSLVQRRITDARYFDRYAEIIKSEDIRAEAGWVDGVPAIAMYRPASNTVSAYFVLLEWTGGRISLIRDFRYVPYIASDARFLGTQ